MRSASSSCPATSSSSSRSHLLQGCCCRSPHTQAASARSPLAAYVALAVAFKERADVPTLLASTALSFLPLCLFGAALHLLSEGPGFSSSIFADSAAVTVMFAFFQAWGAGVVGAGMSVASGLRVEKTLVVSLVVLYATMLIILLQGGRLS